MFEVVVGPDDPAAGVYSKNRLWRYIQQHAHGGFAFRERAAGFEQGAVDHVLIHQDDEHSADLVLGCTERFHAQGIPPAVPVLEGAVENPAFVGHLRQQSFPGQLS